MARSENNYESISPPTGDSRIVGFTQELAHNRKRNLNIANFAVDQNESVPQFESKARNIQLLYHLISSVQSFGDFCLLDISNDGMCFSINDGNVCKVRLNLNQKVFESYIFNGVWRDKSKFPDEQLYAEETDLSEAELDGDSSENCVTNSFDKNAVISINLNIASFLETINIHVKDKKNSDQSIECTFRYDREGDPFVMMFEDDSIIERCELNTYYIEDYEPKTNRVKKGKRGSKKGGNINDNTNVMESFGIENQIVDDSIFRLNSRKILFDIIIKPNILHDIIKDLNDLNTDKFILYCHKTSGNNGNEKSIGDDERERRSSLIFISKSKSDTIGFSKIIIPQRKLNIPEFKLFKPVLSGTDGEEIEFIDCCDLPISSTYHFEYFSRLLKAIKLSKLIKIRKDMDGITSLLLLLGKNPNASNQLHVQQPDFNELYGSSIEFVTLESIPIDELSALAPKVRSQSLLSKLGYGNSFVEQLIKDDQDIQTIRVGNNGQLITLDDYFGNDAVAEFENFEHINIHDKGNEVRRRADVAGNYIPIEQVNVRKTKENHQDENVLQLTEQLTLSLLGHATPRGVKTGPDNIEVEQSMTLNDGENETEKNRKRASNYKRDNDANVRTKRRKTKTKPGKGTERKRKNDGIETVGGAIEIPLFI